MVDAWLHRLSGFRVEHDPPCDMNFSYRIVGSLPGRHGGRTKVIRNESGRSSWFHPAPPTAEDAFSGDPLWHDHWGAAFARWFEIAPIGDHLRIQPDAQEAEGLLDALEEQLGIRPSVRFYCPETPHVSEEEYGRAFVEHGCLPIAACTHEASHDVNFHFLAFLLPAEIVEHLRACGRALFGLCDHLRSQGVEEAGIQKTLDAWAEVVDHATGSPQFGLNPSIPSEMRGHDSVEDAFRHWSCKELPAAETVEEHVLRQLGTHAPGVAWRPWLEAYRETAPDLSWDRRLGLTRDEVLQQTVERLRALLDGVAALQAEAPLPLPGSAGG